VVVLESAGALEEVVLAAATLQKEDAAAAPLVVAVERRLARLDANFSRRRASPIDGKGSGGGRRSGRRRFVVDTLLTGGGRRKAVLEVLVPNLVARARLVVGVAVGALDEPVAALTPLVVAVLVVGLTAVIHAKRPRADAGAAVRTL
jgi:hypothetical protein